MAEQSHTPAHVYVEVSGLTGTGKSAVMGEIEIALKALGLTIEHDAAFQAEKNGTHADWQEALDLYKPTVVLRERNISRSSGPLAGLAEATPELLEALETALEYVERFEDVRDGDYGVPEPNEAMTLAAELRAAIAKATGGAQ